MCHFVPSTSLLLVVLKEMQHKCSRIQRRSEGSQLDSWGYGQQELRIFSWTDSFQTPSRKALYLPLRSYKSEQKTCRGSLEAFKYFRKHLWVRKQLLSKVRYI